MKYFIKTDENKKLLMLMRERHPLIEGLLEIEMPDEKFMAVSSNLNRYTLVTNGDVSSLVYSEPTEEEIIALRAEEKEMQLNGLRRQRERECFSVINRGQMWYSELTGEQIAELNDWYRAWLDVTQTMTAPEKPVWLK